MSPSLNVRPLVDADHARWDAYVAASPLSHFGQRIAWKQVVEHAYGCPAAYWIAEESGRVRGVLPLFLKRGREPALFSAPGGLLADDEHVASALLAPARERVARERLVHLELRDQRRAWSGLETNPEHVTMVLTLAADEDTQWKAFDAKLRNQIRKGLKSGFDVHWDRTRVEPFHRVLGENMRDLGTPIRNSAYYRTVLDAFGRDADLLVLERAGVPAAAMFTVTHRDTCADPWASALRRFFAWCPNQVLYWEAIRHAIAAGLHHFDFGRSQWESGTFRFKQQWGAAPVPLFYQYVLGRGAHVPTLANQKSGFDAAVQVWKRLPLPVARVLGEPVKRMFPEVM